MFCQIKFTGYWGAVLTTGLLIQFQMAFGVPVLIIVGGYTVYHIIRQRNFYTFVVGFITNYSS
jgi:hypothetical protein